MTPYNGHRVHPLKIWPEFFDALVSEKKSFEVRRSDRDYRVGDILYFLEWDPISGTYLDRRCFRRITYLSDLGRIGCPGFVGLQLEHWSMGS